MAQRSCANDIPALKDQTIMRSMARPFLAPTAFALALACTVRVQAAVMTAQYSQPGGQWQVAFNILNDGTPAQVAHFSVFFDQASFSALSLGASPATWDSIVVQPDLALQAPGFLDSLALSPQSNLGIGQARGGFSVGFNFSGAGTPGSLRFQVLDESFQVLFEGQTVTVPEPPAWLLALLGLDVVRRRLTRTSASAKGQA
jgi:hypothetical protein